MPASMLNVCISGESLPVPESMTTMPPHAHALTRLLLRDTCAYGIHKPVQFMAGHPRIIQARPVAFLNRRTSDMM
jgi:hypothetical protein